MYASALFEQYDFENKSSSQSVAFFDQADLASANFVGFH